MVSIRINARRTKARKKPQYAEHLNDIWREARNPRMPLRRRLSLLRVLRRELRGMNAVRRTLYMKQSRVTLGKIGRLECAILLKLEVIRKRYLQWMRHMAGLLLLLGSMASLLFLIG